MNPRSTFTALGVTAALALPATADAADLYVQEGGGDRSCEQSAPCDLGIAIGRAHELPGPDRIHAVGRLRRTTPLDISGSPIELIGSGAGPGGTSITTGPASPALRLGSASTVRDVFVSSSAEGQPTVSVAGGTAQTTLERVRIQAGPGIAIGATDARLRVGEADISGYSGIESRGAGGRLEVARTTIAASQGIFATGGAVSVSNSLIWKTSSGVVFSGNVTGDVIGSTVHAAHCGVCVQAPATDRGVLVLGSIVKASQYAVGKVGSGPDVVIMASNVVGLVMGATYAGGNLAVEPRWIDPDAGDYRLSADSPLIDQVDAGRFTLAGPDLSGASRSVDGDGDGLAAPDMGALEFVPQSMPREETPSDPGGPDGSTPPRPEGSTQPPVTKPPALRLGGRSLTMGRDRRVRVPVTCPAAAPEPCTIRLVVRTAIGRQRRLGSRTATVGQGVTAKLRIALSSRRPRGECREGGRHRAGHRGRRARLSAQEAVMRMPGPAVSAWGDARAYDAVANAASGAPWGSSASASWVRERTPSFM